MVLPIGKGTVLSWDDAGTPTGTFTPIGCFQEITPPNQENESVFVECLNQEGETRIGGGTVSEFSGNLSWIVGDTDTDEFLDAAWAAGTQYLWRLDNPDWVKYLDWTGRVRAMNGNAIGSKGDPVTVAVIIVNESGLTRTIKP